MDKRSAEEELKILFLSHTADHGAFKVGSHHLARELSKMGHRVAHVSTPLSRVEKLLRRGEASRRALARSRGIVDTFGTLHVVFTTPMPIKLYPHAKLLRRQLRKIGYWDADLILVDQPLFEPVLTSTMRGKVIYRPTDMHASGPRLCRERRLLDKVDAVIATSNEVFAALGPRATLPGHVIENGVEANAFSSLTVRDRAGAIYVGALDERFDWDSLSAMATAHQAIPFDIFGPVKSRPPLLPANVRLRGVAEYARVPQLLTGALVGLMPFNDEVTNSGRSPMKYYEYLSAGLNIAASSTPVLERRTAPGVFLYGTSGGAADALSRALAAPSPNLSGQQVALGHDWRNKALQLLSYAASSVPPKG